MFRGSASTKIDDKGRLKMPTEFRRTLDERWGPDVFLTSVTGDSVLLYPLSIWEDIEARLVESPSSDRTKQRFLERVNYFGQQARLDGQGRFVVPPILREHAKMIGEVVVSGRLQHLEIWNRESFDQKLAGEPFTEEDFQRLAELGI